MAKLDKEVFLTGSEFQIFGPFLIKNCEFFQFSSAVMHTIIIGSPGAIAMNLTVRKKQFGNQINSNEKINTLSLLVSVVGSL